MQEAKEAAWKAALLAETNSQAERPPLCVEKWRAHIFSEITLHMTYFPPRFNDTSGDRFEMTEFCCGACICDPSYAKTMSCSNAMDLIENLRPFHVLTALVLLCSGARFFIQSTIGYFI